MCNFAHLVCKEIYMDKVNSLFNHPKKENPDREPGLYEWKRPSFHKDDVSQLNRLLKKIGRRKTEKQHNWEESVNLNHHVRSEGSESNRKQKVVSKLSIGYKLEGHKKFLEQYMRQLDKSEVPDKPELFGSDLDEYKAHMVANHFKLIISPENQNVDLEVLTRHFIEQLENLTGYELYWEAAIHTNTEHRHAHLAINGVDKNGQKVQFTREMIKEKMRTILSEAATNMVGERTYEEIKAEEAKLPLSPRWTKLDERLSQYKGKIYSRVLDVSLQQRLGYLCQINLAEKNGELFTLKPDWKEKLQIFGRYNTFMSEYLSLGGNITLYQGGQLNGIVEKTITFDKDESWNDAVIVKTSNGRVYVPVYNLQKENIEGKTVNIDMPYFDSMKKISDKEIRIQKTKPKSTSFER